MWISELPQETIEELCSALEKCATLNWKALMRKSFSTYYSEVDVAMIESREHPAKALLDDLTLREIPLEVLVDGLKEIGNNKAVSIIRKGITQKRWLDERYSGGRPPPYFSVGQPQQHEDFSFSCTQPLQCRQQTETLKHPVQESVVRDEHPSEPGLEVPLDWGEAVVSQFFSCFSSVYNVFNGHI